MDKHRFSSIGHTDHVYCSPLDPNRVEQLLGLLDLPSSAQVIDVGCGKAELLIRLVERYGVRATGVDISPYFIDEAQRRAAARIPAGSLELQRADAASHPVEPESFDMAVSIGSSVMSTSWPLLSVSRSRAWKKSACSLGKKS